MPIGHALSSGGTASCEGEKDTERAVLLDRAGIAASTMKVKWLLIGIIGLLILLLFCQARHFGAAAPHVPIHDAPFWGLGSPEWCTYQPAMEQTSLYEGPPASENITAYKIRLLPGSGMTSALVGILEGVMYASAHGHPFFLDESQSPLRVNHSDFYNRYFHPIGLQTAPTEFEDITYTGNVTDFSRTNDITIGSETAPKFEMKRRWVRRIWRMRPEIQTEVCHAIRNLNLPGRYLSILVRRGDKMTLEHVQNVPLEHYNATLSGASLGGLITDVFVATDDCRVLKELEARFPMWSFASLCHVDAMDGWDIRNVTGFDLHSHFIKFVAEMVVMAAATTVVVDLRSNVGHWVYYMRPVTDSPLAFIDIRKFPYEQGVM